MKKGNPNYEVQPFGQKISQHYKLLLSFVFYVHIRK